MNFGFYDHGTKIYKVENNYTVVLYDLNERKTLFKNNFLSKRKAATPHENETTKNKVEEVSGIKILVPQNLEKYDRLPLLAFYTQTVSKINPKNTSNEISIYNPVAKKFLTVINFDNIITGIRFTSCRLMVSTSKNIYLYDLPKYSLMNTFDTLENGLGLMDISTNSKVLVYTDSKNPSTLHVVNGQSAKTVTIDKENGMSMVQLNHDGSLLAIANKQGSSVYIVNVDSLQIMQHLKRGLEDAEIYGITFSPTSEFLALFADTKTLHIFAIKDKTTLLNETWKISYLKHILPQYFSCEWSFQKKQLPDKLPSKITSIIDLKTKETTFKIVNNQGNWYNVTIKNETGEIVVFSNGTVSPTSSPLLKPTATSSSTIATSANSSSASVDDINKIQVTAI